MIALGVCFPRPSCSHARALAAGLSSQDHVRFTTDQLVRFHKNQFDEIPRKLDSSEIPRSFGKYPTPPSSQSELPSMRNMIAAAVLPWKPVCILD